MCTDLSESEYLRLQAKCHTYVCLWIFLATESKAFFSFSQVSMTSPRLKPSVLCYLQQMIVLIEMTFCCVFPSEHKVMP